MMSIYAFRFVPREDLSNLVALAHGRIEVGLVSLLLFVLGIWILQPYLVKKKISKALINDNELGRIGISLSAIESLVQKNVQQQKGVEEVKSRLSRAGEGVEIRLNLKVLPDLDLPQLTTNIQNSLRDYLQRVTGVKIEKVQVLVEEIRGKVPARVE